MNRLYAPLSLTFLTLALLTASAHAEAYTTSVPEARAPGAATEKQPVFLICPKHHGYSAWSLYVVVDRNNPQKVLALGLDELQKKNAEDMTYEDVVAAQNDPHTRRKNLGTLDAAQFGSGTIDIRESDALHVSVTPVEKNELRLNMSMRISFDGRFTIGGKDQGSRDVVFKYDPDKKAWGACAKHLNDTSGRDAANGSCLPLTGIVFPVSGTGIYRVVAAGTNGEAVIVMDR